MNRHYEYRRHTPSVSSPAGQSDSGLNQLAVTGDPSLAGQSSNATTLTGRRIAWVRPTDLHSYAGQAIGRGVDLHAELIRRANTTPRRLTRSVPRARHHLAEPTPDPPSIDQKGIDL